MYYLLQRFIFQQVSVFIFENLIKVEYPINVLQNNNYCSQCLPFEGSVLCALSINFTVLIGSSVTDADLVQREFKPSRKDIDR